MPETPFFLEKILQYNLSFAKIKSFAIAKTGETLTNKYYEKQIESMDSTMFLKLGMLR